MSFQGWCTVDGCEKAVKATGLCGTHYAAKRRYNPDRPRCAFPGCEKAMNAKGFCVSHYGQFLRGEELRVSRSFGLSTAERLLEYAAPDPETGCIIWNGKITKKGYGQIGIDGVSYLVHRVAWELEKGPVPEGLVLDHLCRRPPCFNVHHLEPVTNYVNVVIRGQGAAAKNLRKTHCPKGHPLVPDLSPIHASKGYRYCEVCARERVR